MFNERKTKLTLLSLLSAVAVLSTAFAGISTYAQTDSSNTTTFEDEAQNGTEDSTTTVSTTSSDNSDSAKSSNDTSTAHDSANSTSSGTSTADVKGLFDGLIVCDVGTAEVDSQTQSASVDNSNLGTPTVTVKVMTQEEVAAAAGNETGTASTSNTNTDSAGCKILGKDNSTNDNGTSTDNAQSTSSNTTSTASSGAPDSNQQILVIDGKDFAPGQVVLIFSDNQLVGIDDVDNSGNIEAKIPQPHAGGSNGTSTASASTDLRFVESGTLRSGTFSYDGQTLTSSQQGDIQAEGSATPSPDNNTTSPASGSSSSNNTTNNTGNSTPTQ